MICLRTPLISTIAVALLVAACTSPAPADDQPPVDQPDPQQQQQDDEVDQQEDPQEGVVGMVAVAEVHSYEEDQIGEVEFTQTEDGVEVDGRIELEELADGPRGFHVHEHGECDPPDFESAGPHFNHPERPHGGPDDPPEQRHAGDFGNIEFDEDGVAEFSFVDEVIAVGGGDNDIVDRALIVHFEQDDLETQPTGDAGDRAGCGLIEAVRDDVQ